MLPPILNTPPISHPFHLSRLSPCPTLYESQSTGFKLPVSYSNSHWLFILNMVMYMFQHYAFNSSLPLVPPLCPQVCSLRLHLHSCPSNSFISTIFLDSIYIYPLIFYICFSLSDLQVSLVAQLVKNPPAMREI